MKVFFFAPESPRALAVLRIALGLVLLVEAASRWPFAIELYSSAGLPMPPFPPSSLSPNGPESAAGPRALALPPLGPTATVILHSLLLFALAAATLGWQTRPSLAAAFLLLAWFSLLDLPATMTKYTAIVLHLLVLLACSRSGTVWSVDRWLSPDQSVRCELGPAWPRRLVQILVCSVYWQAAVTKIRLPDFASGDLLEFSLLNDRWGGTAVGLWLSAQPGLVRAASSVTLAFELFFPVLVWVPRMRRPMLAGAIVFHTLLAVVMNLGAFSFIMLAALAAFVEERDFRRLGAIGRALRDRVRPPGERRAPSPGQPAATARARRYRPVVGAAAWGLLAAAFASAGLLAQRAADWYGVYGATRVESRPALDESAVNLILAEQQPVYADYVHRFEIGSRLGFRRTFGSHTHFRRGMTAHALARFIWDDEPLELEWLLIAPDGREVARHAHRLAARTAYASVGFALTDEAPPGRYRIILQIEGVPAAERAFLLEAD